MVSQEQNSNGDIETVISGFENGTTDPESIGKSVTEGCVRMKNVEVEELSSLVPIGTEVSILD